MKRFGLMWMFKILFALNPLRGFPFFEMNWKFSYISFREQKAESRLTFVFWI
jgi:hypothetical protein